jgi:uncharacterized LabA/DUF88 family protein
VAEREPSVAVLIDAENTPYNAIKQILDASARYGNTIIRRAYGDWTTTNLKPWTSIFKEYAIRPMHQFQFTTGKNSTDIAMVIDALDLLHEKLIDVFLLATSDSDFTALATRLREEGVTVIGVGRNIAPPSFVKGCDQFLTLESMEGVQPVAQKETEEIKHEQRKSSSPVTKSQLQDEGRDLLVRAAKQAADVGDGIIRGAFLGSLLRRLDPKFSPPTTGSTAFPSSSGYTQMC